MRGSSLARAIRSARLGARSRLGRYPRLYLPLARLIYRRRRLAASTDTEMVIEGYPRSGNTFAVVAFELAQPKPVRVAHHLHVPAQTLWAVRAGVPALTLIRQPAHAVVSRVIRQPGLSLGQALREYIRYYESLRPHLAGFVTASFEEVTRDFGAVIERVNERFDTRFVPFRHDSASVSRCFARIDQLDELHKKRTRPSIDSVGRPSRERDELKKPLLHELERDWSGLVGEADALYGAFTAGVAQRARTGRTETRS